MPCSAANDETRPAPVVSVLLPVRDGGVYFPAAVASILAQETVPFELIVIDDGSVDGSREWIARHADPRILHLCQPPTGLVAALNRGLAQAKGKYIARMDADDEALPSRLREQVETLEALPDVGALFTDAVYIDGQGRTLGFERGGDLDEVSVREGLLFRRHRRVLIHPSVLMRRDVLASLGGYRNYAAAEDADLWLRLSRRTKIRQMSRVLLRYRKLPTSVSRRHRHEQMSNAALAAVNDIVEEATGIDLWTSRRDLWEKCQQRLRLSTAAICRAEANRLQLVRVVRERHWFSLPSIALRMLLRSGNLCWLHRVKESRLKRLVEAEASALAHSDLGRSLAPV